MLSIGSLCAGYGGLDLAVESVVDAATIWYCEVEPHAARVFSSHWPDCPNYGDIKIIDWHAVEPVDILIAGYPCQPFSSAGFRRGTDDERHLWPYVAAAIRGLRPRLVVLENVAGHRSLGFGDVLGDLAAARYDAQWTSVRASDVGAPHRRERLFILAADTERQRLAGGRRAWHGWAGSADGDHGRAAAAADTDRAGDAHREPWGEPETVEPRGGSAADADVAGLEGQRGFHAAPGEGQAGAHDRAATHTAHGEPRAGNAGLGSTARGGSAAHTGRHRCGQCGQAHHRPQLRRFTFRDLIDGRVAATAHPHAATIRRLPGLRRRAARADMPDLFGPYRPAIDRWAAVIGRPAPAVTVLAPRTGQPRLSPLFVEWMMGLPAGWVTDQDLPWSAQIHMLGNGVVPAQAQAGLLELLTAADIEAAA